MVGHGGVEDAKLEGSGFQMNKNTNYLRGKPSRCPSCNVYELAIGEKNCSKCRNAIRPDMTLREKVEEIMTQLVSQGPNASLSPSASNSPYFNYNSWNISKVPEIMQLIEEYCEELIGKDTPYNQNYLRAQQRTKLKKDLV